MQNSPTFKYINEARFKSLFNWSVGSILGNKLHYKKGFSLEPIGSLIVRNRIKEIIEDEKFYKQVTIKLYGKGVIQRGNELIEGKSIGTKNQFRISKGQFIMSKIDARNGAFGIVPKDLGGAITTQDFLSYNINTDKILPEFFNLITSTDHFAKLCQRASSGTTGRQRVNEKEFLSFKIPVPDKIVQQGLINNYISNQEKQIESLNQISKLEEKKKIAFLEELGLPLQNFDRNKKRFSLHQFKNLARWDVFSSDNSIYTALKNSKYQVKQLADSFEFTKRSWSKKNEENYEFSYIELGNVDPLIGITQISKILTKNAPSRATQIVKTGDLIIGTTRPYLKRFAIVDSKFNGNVCSSGFSILRASPNYNLHFLKQFLISDYGIEQLKNQMSGALYPAITLNKLKTVLIPIPPKSVQDKITDTMSHFENEIIRLKNEVEKLQESAKEDFETAMFAEINDIKQY